MVNVFKRRHTSNLIGSEMYDDGFNHDTNSDDEVKQEQDADQYRRNYGDDDQVRQDFDDFDANHYDQNEEVNNKEEEKDEDFGDYPHIDSPRLSNDFKKDRTFKVNRKLDNESDEDYNVGSEREPEIKNLPNPTMDRKASSSTNNGDYEVIGDHPVRETISMKKRDSLDSKNRVSQSTKSIHKYIQDLPKYAKTQKGYSDISQLAKKNLSALVHKHAVCKDGFFSFSYASYEVQLNPIGWKVRRKESDFVFLREYLRKKYPQHFVSIVLG